MTLSQEAQHNRPKKPLNAYFRLRGLKLEEFKDDPEKMEKAKQAWQEIDPKYKTQLEAEYHKEMQQFPAKLAAWKKKYNVADEDLKRKSKKRAVDSDDEENKKPIKAKGKDSKQAAKVSDKKKEEPKKSKSTEKEAGKSKKEDPKVEKKKGK